MDEKFREMLVEAERIRELCRIVGKPGLHSEHMARLIRYGMERGLLTGNVAEGTETEENLAQCTETAACVLEVIHGQKVGSILSLTRERKIEINLHARKRSLMSLAFRRQYGRMPEKGELPGEG